SRKVCSFGGHICNTSGHLFWASKTKSYLNEWSNPEISEIALDLLKMNVAPLAVFQTLKTMCAGQKVSETSTGDTSTASHTATAPSESRVRSKTSSGQGEKSARDGSSQRVPRQVSATRGQKSAKSSGSSSSSSQLTSN
uniref:Mitotic spindle organizing protein 2B n=2 Tax=Sinocyclocheilus TaxID=75365 RepID=A0A672NCL4_SINGR